MVSRMARTPCWSGMALFVVEIMKQSRLLNVAGIEYTSDYRDCRDNIPAGGGGGGGGLTVFHCKLGHHLGPICTQSHRHWSGTVVRHGATPRQSPPCSDHAARANHMPTTVAHALAHGHRERNCYRTTNVRPGSDATRGYRKYKRPDATQPHPHDLHKPATVDTQLLM